jgi:uncharacterized membrane protein YqiK
MKKYAQGEGELEVLQGREAGVLHSYMERLGKYQVSEFSDADREALMRELDQARALDRADFEEREKRVAAAEKAAETRERNAREAREAEEARIERERPNEVINEEPEPVGDDAPKPKSARRDVPRKG